MKDLKALVIDMDGVLWTGDTPMQGLNAFFDTLNDQNIPFILATNNAMRVASQYVEKLAKFNVSVQEQQVLTSSEASASYLRQTYPDEETAFVIGEEGLHIAMKAQGFHIISPEEIKAGVSTNIVVGGLLRESLNYDSLAMATLAVRQGATFVASNYDSSFPSELGFLPGAGAILSVIEKASGVSPTIVGKPYPIMFQEALKRLATSPQETGMIGDRLNTDIEGAKNANMKTILVLSGVATLEDVQALDDKPDYICQDITEISQKLKS